MICACVLYDCEACTLCVVRIRRSVCCLSMIGVYVCGFKTGRLAYCVPGKAGCVLCVHGSCLCCTGME